MSYETDSEDTPYYAECLNELDSDAVSDIIAVSLSVLRDERGSFEQFCRAFSYGEAYLPLPSEDEYSEKYNAVYSRIVSRAVRLRAEGERMDGERNALIDAVERLQEYPTDASGDELTAFIEATEGDWLDSVPMFWDTNSNVMA